MDKIVGIAGVITAMATACAAVVGLMRMFRRAETPEALSTGPARVDPPRPPVPTQAWSGSDRPATPPTPAPTPPAASWYQQIPRLPGNSWVSDPDLAYSTVAHSPVSNSAVSDSPIPEQPNRPTGPPNQWWHGAQPGERIRTPSRYGP